MSSPAPPDGTQDLARAIHALAAEMKRRNDIMERSSRPSGGRDGAGSTSPGEEEEQRPLPADRRGPLTRAMGRTRTWYKDYGAEIGTATIALAGVLFVMLLDKEFLNRHADQLILGALGLLTASGIALIRTAVLQAKYNGPTEDGWHQLLGPVRL